MASHKIRMKRGKKRYYPTSSLRRKIKTGMKRRGFSKKERRKATRAGFG